MIQELIEIFTIFFFVMENTGNEREAVTECATKATCRKHPLSKRIFYLIYNFLMLFVNVGLIIYLWSAWTPPFTLIMKCFLGEVITYTFIMLIVDIIDILQIQTERAMNKLNEKYEKYEYSESDKHSQQFKIDESKYLELSERWYRTSYVIYSLSFISLLLDICASILILLFTIDYCGVMEVMTLILAAKGILWGIFRPIGNLRMLNRILRNKWKVQDAFGAETEFELAESKFFKFYKVWIILELILTSLSSGSSLFAGTYILTTPSCTKSVMVRFPGDIQPRIYYTSNNSHSLTDFHSKLSADTWNVQEWKFELEDNQIVIVKQADYRFGKYSEVQYISGTTKSATYPWKRDLSHLEDRNRSGTFNTDLTLEQLSILLDIPVSNLEYWLSHRPARAIGETITPKPSKNKEDSYKILMIKHIWYVPYKIIPVAFIPLFIVLLSTILICLSNRNRASALLTPL